MIEESDRLRAALLASNARELERLARAYYDTVFNATAADREAFLAMLQQEGITAEQIRRSAIYQRLVSNLEKALAAYGSFLTVEIGNVIRSGVVRGGLDAMKLIKIGGGTLGINLSPRQLPVDAALQALNLLDPNGPLVARLRMYDAYHAADIAQRVFDAVVMGKNPIPTAKLINQLYGMPLSDAMRLTRTAQLYSYRLARHLNYAANSDVVTGWIWAAKLDGDTCLSCWAQHGTIHPHDEQLRDHHLGRCTPLPAVFGFNPIDVSGQMAFGNLSAEEQLKLMGPGRYQAWIDGKFDFSQLSTTHLDDVYGEMRVVAPLKDLVPGS